MAAADGRIISDAEENMFRKVSCTSVLKPYYYSGSQIEVSMAREAPCHRWLIPRSGVS